MLRTGLRCLTLSPARSLWPKPRTSPSCESAIAARRYSTQRSTAFAAVDRHFPLSFTWTVARWFVTGWLGIHLFVQYFYEAAPASGISMLPTIPSHGSVLLVSKYYRRGREIKVGDVVSYKQPRTEDSNAVKRVIGMPGDFVLGGTPGEGKGMLLQVPQGHCYVVGDNLTWSRDSRLFGPLPLALIRGKVIARWGPEYTEFVTVKHGLLDVVNDGVD